MGQVPENSTFVLSARVKYLIIGSGRVARHFENYFTFESIPFSRWSRSDTSGLTGLKELLESATHVLLLISDSAIDTFYREHETLLAPKTCVHFSGALVSSLVPSAHPLMTFSHSLYDRETYLRLPFVLEEGRGSMATLLPGLTNPSLSIRPDLKGRYHAFCVMSGNFTTLLWEKTFREFEETLGLPRQILLPYLLQVTENLALSKPGSSVLTGPLARGDEATIKKNLAELKDDPFAQVYLAFARAHKEEARHEIGTRLPENEV